MKPVGSVFLIIAISLPPGVVYAGAVSGNSAAPDVKEAPALSADEYDQRVRLLESEYGVYHPAIGETLLSLGMLYLTQHKYPQAMDSFERALQIQRINAGLYNLDQTRLVKLMIEIASSYKDWDKVGDNLHYLLWIYRRNYHDDEEKLLPELKELGQLIVEAYRPGAGKLPLNSLFEADDINTETEVILEGRKDSEEDRVNALYRTAIINYHIADAVNSSRVSHREIREAMLENHRVIPDVDEDDVRENISLQSFFKGKNAIGEIIDIYKSDLPGSAEKYAEALIFLGDWYLVFNLKWNAMPRYENAYAVLEENHVPEEKIKAMMGEPKPLNFLILPGEKIRAPNPNALYVDAVLDVPSTGWPANIKIIKTNPADNENLRRRGKLAIAGVRYRPRFDKGKPVDAKNVEFKYVFDIQHVNGGYLEQGGENAFFLRDVIDK